MSDAARTALRRYAATAGRPARRGAARPGRRALHRPRRGARCRGGCRGSIAGRPAAGFRHEQRVADAGVRRRPPHRARDPGRGVGRRDLRPGRRHAGVRTRRRPVRRSSWSAARGSGRRSPSVGCDRPRRPRTRPPSCRASPRTCRGRLLAEGAYAVTAGLPWLASNLDATIPTPRGIAPGNGALVQVIAGATGRRPDAVAGKPETPLHDEAVRRTGARRPLVVGDRLDTDIEGANSAGVPSLLVLTGVAGPADLVQATGRVAAHVRLDGAGGRSPRAAPGRRRAGRRLVVRRLAGAARHGCGRRAAGLGRGSPAGRAASGQRGGLGGGAAVAGRGGRAGRRGWASEVAAGAGGGRPLRASSAA